MRRLLLSVALITFLCFPIVAADDGLPSADEIKAVLEPPILDEGIPQKEVEAFCSARVLRLPADDAPQRKSAEAWTKYQQEIRQQTLDRVICRGEAAKWRSFKGRVEWQEAIKGGEGYTIKKLRFEAVPDLWVPALLYLPEKLAEKSPVFLNVNGHDSKGKAAVYKQTRCINMAKRGMIVLNLEWFGMGQLRGPGFVHYKLNQLDLCGTSGVAPFYLAMQRGLDILLEQDHADPTRVGVAGLSGGGWQTIVFSALDTRVTLANPVAGYSSFLTRIQHYSDLGDSEQTPVDLAATADYSHLTALLAPRATLLTYNEKDDCCFAAPHALPPLREAARGSFQALGKIENLHEHINYNPGTHNFERDNREALYKVIGQHWYASDSSFSPVEIPCDHEIKKADELAVELPADNLDLQKLANQLMRDLPRGKADRAALQGILRLAKSGSGKLETDAGEKIELRGVRIVRRKLCIDNQWTVPAIEFSPGNEQGAAIVLADAGRVTTSEKVRELLASHWRVVVVDPFYFGESKIRSHDFLFALLVSSVGERSLGIQAGQVQRIASWLKSEHKAKQVRLFATGSRTSLIALAAAASDESIDGVELQGSLGSLKEIIEQGGQVDKTPEQFCFGLLETADIAQIAALIVPREVRFANPSERVQKELGGLQEVYKRAGKEFDPLADR